MPQNAPQMPYPYVSPLQAEYERERRVFHIMKNLALAIGIPAAVLFFAFSLYEMPTDVGGYGLYGYAAYIAVMLGMSAFIGIAIGCVPARYMGAWRAIRRSGVFVWGGIYVLLVIMTLLILVPAVCGFFFLLGQLLRVHRLESQLAAPARMQ